GLRRSTAKGAKFKRGQPQNGARISGSRLHSNGHGKITAFKSKGITRLVKARRTSADSLLKAKTEAEAAEEIQVRLRELIKLAKEQGYLTFDDLNEALPDGITDANELDAILTRLRRMEID